MVSFYKGKEDDVWQTALKIEDSRQRKRDRQREEQRKRNLRGKKKDVKNCKDEVTRRSDRAKMLTNDGELSKAFATMVQRGVAPSTQNIIKQLKEKFPTRKRDVIWPDKNRIDILRNLVEKTVIEMDIDESKDKR